MEPKFQTSFIPKRPVLDPSRTALPTVKNINIFSAIASLIFTLTILLSLGLFGYRYYLINKIIEADKNLNSARAAFEPEKIKQLLDASTRFGTINNLLENHFVVSELLKKLQELTLKNISFGELSYKYQNGVISVDMTGQARSYNSLARQSEVFKESSVFENILFSDFILTDTGSVSFKYSANVVRDLVSYKKLIQSNSSE